MDINGSSPPHDVNDYLVVWLISYLFHFIWSIWSLRSLSVGGSFHSGCYVPVHHLFIGLFNHDLLITIMVSSSSSWLSVLVCMPTVTNDEEAVNT